MKPKSRSAVARMNAERQFKYWVSSIAVQPASLGDAGLEHSIRKILYHHADPAYRSLVDYLPQLLKEARERGTPRLKALLVSLALQGKI